MKKIIDFNNGMQADVQFRQSSPLGSLLLRLNLKGGDGKPWQGITTLADALDENEAIEVFWASPEKAQLSGQIFGLDCERLSLIIRETISRVFGPEVRVVDERTEKTI